MSSISRREFLRISGAVVAGTILTACQPTAQPTTAPVPNQPAETKPTEPPAAAQPTEAPKDTHPTAWPLGDVPRNRTLIY